MASPVLASGERLLVGERDRRGAPVVATARAVYHQDVPDGGGVWRRLGWEQVGRVDWDNQRHILILTGLTPDIAPRTVLRLRPGTALPALARERVAWTTLLGARVRLDQVGTLLTVRRQPGSDRLHWFVAVDTGVDRDDPATAARLTSVIAQVRAHLGI